MSAWEGKLVCNNEELSKLYGLTEMDKKTYIGLDAPHRAMEIPANGNFFDATMAGGGQLARNVTLKQWWGESLDSGVINFQRLSGRATDSLVGYAGTLTPHTFANTTNPLMTVKGGMERIVVELASKLKGLGVALLTNHEVIRVKEMKRGFEVKAVADGSRALWYLTDKLILACNARGAELITWISEADRTTEMQKLVVDVARIGVTKLHLTYKEPWWEKSGIKRGEINTDLPITAVLLYGGRGKKNGYATLTVYSYVDAEVLDGMNNEEDRFENTEGDIPQQQIPSRILVESVQRQLSTVFDNTEIPQPVAACVSTWHKDPIGCCQYRPKVGVDHNALYWRSLRPFGDESDVFMIGDTFVAADKKAVYTGWTEGALLTAERILHKYFDLQPYLEGMCLNNPWPEED